MENNKQTKNYFILGSILGIVSESLVEIIGIIFYISYFVSLAQNSSFTGILVLVFVALFVIPIALSIISLNMLKNVNGIHKGKKALLIISRISAIIAIVISVLVIVGYCIYLIVLTALSPSGTLDILSRF